MGCATLLSTISMPCGAAAEAAAVFARAEAADTGRSIGVHENSSPIGTDPHEASEHQPLPVSADLSLKSIVDHALAQAPDRLALAGAAAELATWNARGRRLLAGNPALSFRYQTDRFNDDLGIEEIESGLELPIWRWGERAATRRYGEQLDEAVAASTAVLRWTVAGAVRDVLHELNRAELELQAMTRISAQAQRVHEAVARQQALGDASRHELLLARSSMLQAQSAQLDAEAALLDAQIAYRSLVGLPLRPPPVAEPEHPGIELPETHPLLTWHGTRVAEASAKLAMLRKGAGGNPTLHVGPRRERGAAELPFEDSIGVTLRVPLGGSLYPTPGMAEAERALGEAQAARDKARRALQLDWHEARHELEVATRRLQLARQQGELAEATSEMNGIAYQRGELDLFDYLRLEAATSTQLLALHRAEADYLRAVAYRNQILGDTP
ncbi:MAG: TolC family protein [Pseudomonadales bacterium]